MHDVRTGDRNTTHSVPLRDQGSWAEQFIAPEGHIAALPPAGFPAVVAEFLRSEQVSGRMLALEVGEQTGTAGDRVLADLAQACREYVRPDDIAGRYGGDEFIVVIPGTTRLRAAKIASQLTGPAARVTGSDGKLVGFTVSVGAAESGCCPDLPSLVAHVGHAIYEAKRAGGGCFRIFENAQHAPDPALP